MVLMVSNVTDTTSRSHLFFHEIVNYVSLNIWCVFHVLA